MKQDRLHKDLEHEVRRALDTGCSTETRVSVRLGGHEVRFSRDRPWDPEVHEWLHYEALCVFAELLCKGHAVELEPRWNGYGLLVDMAEAECEGVRTIQAVRRYLAQELGAGADCDAPKGCQNPDVPCSPQSLTSECLRLEASDGRTRLMVTHGSLHAVCDCDRVELLVFREFQGRVRIDRVHPLQIAITAIPYGMAPQQECA